MCFVFFFQAEDGIRDLVRSRGLGDVYKRQVLLNVPGGLAGDIDGFAAAAGDYLRKAGLLALEPVSYTHLTLPTSDLV